MMTKKKSWVIWVPLMIAGIVLFVGIGGFVVELLWNWLLPSLFGLPQIGFWQAVGLLALCRILFGGFGSPQHRSGSRVRRRVEERLEEMTPEERERLRRALHGRGLDPPSGEQA